MSAYPDWSIDKEIAAGPFIDYWAGVFRIEPAIAYGLVSQESRFTPQAYRAEPAIHDASYGLTQILMRTAQGLGYTGDTAGLYEPSENVQLGLRYLRQQLDRWGSITLALSAYNGGLIKGVITNPEYVASVLDRADYFRAQWAANGIANPETDLSTTGTSAGGTVAAVAIVGLIALLAKRALQ